MYACAHIHAAIQLYANARPTLLFAAVVASVCHFA